MGPVKDKILTFSEKSLIGIWLFTDQMSLKSFLLQFFVNFGHSFYCFKSIFLSAAPNLRYRRILKYFFLNYVSFYITSKTGSPIFKILFRTWDINIFILHCAISVLYFQIKSSSSCKKETLMVEFETCFCSEVVKI